MKRPVLIAVLIGMVLGPCLIYPAGVNNSTGGSTINAAQINPAGHLVFTKTDGTKLDAGALPTSVASISVGTPTAATPGKDGDAMMDGNYLYTFLSGSWKKTVRANL